MILLRKIKLINLTIPTVGVIISIIILNACTKDPQELNTSDYPAEIGKIFLSKCATSGCHNDASYIAAAGLNLSSWEKLFEGSSNGSPVIPFRSDFSSLCYFINTYEDFGIQNSPRMPINGRALSKNEVKTIKDWIDSGAPNLSGDVKWSNNVSRDKYYVLNQGCDVVTVFDANTQLPMRYVSVGNKDNLPESPHMIKISPDGKYWYVIFLFNNIIQKFSTSDDRFIAEATLGNYQDWNTIAISNDGKYGYCVSWQSNSRIAVVDLINMKLLKNIGGFADAHGIALNNTNDTIYVTRQSGNQIYKMDTAFNNINTVVIDVAGTMPSQTPGNLDPHEITFSPNGNYYFVTCQSANSVRVMQTSGDVFVANISTGEYPLEMAKSITRNKLYVTCQNDPNTNPKIKGSVTVIDMSTFSSNNYKVGYQPHGIAIDERNDFLIIASRNLLINGPTPHHTGVCGRNGFVNYFNLNTMQLVTNKTEVASDPYSVAIKQ